MTVTTSPAHVAARALPILRSLQQQRREWEEHADEMARQGYRPHYCPHGTNWWVDYDPICYWCESDVTIRERALMLAHEALDVENRMLNAAVEYVNALRDAGATQDEIDEAVVPFTSVYRRRMDR